jgi:hypothetical protein
MPDTPSLVGRDPAPESDALREFLAHAAMVRDFAQDDLEEQLSEAMTRTACILPVLHLLGYRDIVDIREEVPIRDTKEFLDYELRVDGRAIVIVEAKRLAHPLTLQDGGQCVKYASVRGVRWCLVTNGREWQVFDGRAPDALATKKVAAVSLGNDDGAAQAWSVLSLFSRDSLARAMPLTRLLVDRVVEDDLHRVDSAAVRALQKTVKQRFAEDVSSSAIVDSVRRLFGSAFTGRDQPSEAEPLGPSAISSVNDSPRDSLRHRRAIAEDGAMTAVELSGAGQRAAMSDLQALIDGQLLPPGAILECTASGVSHRGRVRDGKIELDGKLYSPSAAAREVLGGGQVNGWKKWRCDGVLLDDLRQKLWARRHSIGGSAT